MKVLVTGGTGFVGGAVVKELHRAGHGIYLLARNPNSQKVQTEAARCSAQVRSGNVLDAHSLADSATGIDAVIHLVGIISEVGEQTFEKVHTEGTRNMITAAQKSGVKRFVHMSALGTRPNAVARYHQSKWAAEELVRQSGLDWTIFRPSIIYGPGDGFVNLFAGIARRSPAVPILGSGESRFQPVHVNQVAKAFVNSLNEPRAVGQTFTLAGPEVFTLNQIVDALLKAMQRKRLKLHLPLGIARVQAALVEGAFNKLLHRAPPLNRDQVVMLQEDNVGDGQPANDLLELKHGSFQEGITTYLR